MKNSYFFVPGAYVACLRELHNVVFISKESHEFVKYDGGRDEHCLLYSDLSSLLIVIPFIRTTSRVIILLLLTCRCCCLPTPMTLASGGGGVRSSRLWSTNRLLRPSGQQCSHSAGSVHKFRADNVELFNRTR